MKHYPRPTGEIGDNYGSLPDLPSSNVPFAGDFDKSLADASRGDLKKGYCPKGSIKSTSKSDEPDWA